MSATDNKRIARNTVFLYFRMLLVMGISFYTSRVVLNTLGIDDFGIYNIVGGVVVLFSFMRGGITSAIQRYINYALGKNDHGYVQQIFISSFHILGWLSAILLVVLETAGLWFVNHKLSIPPGSMFATNVVYQLSILTFIAGVLRSPYESLIMAHERMSFYAYISIVEALLKLLIVFMLVIVSADKLILYASLTLVVTLVISLIFAIYNRIHFRLRVFGRYDRGIVRDLTSFSGWNIFGSIADIGYQQGTNVILNMFYGVAFNATMGIGNQVKNAVFSFVRNIVIAANPQIYKLYAAGQTDEFEHLVLRISKFAFFLFLCIAIPLIFNMEYILCLWLGDLPPKCSRFCVLIIIFCLIDTLTGPLWTAAQAQGDIRLYQIYTSAIMLLNLPLTYIFFRCGFAPEYLLYIQIAVVILTLIFRIFFLNHKKIIPASGYLRNVILPVSVVSAVSLALCLVINAAHPACGLGRLAVNTPLYLIGTMVAIWAVGLTSSERKLAASYLSKFLNKSKSSGV